MLLLAVAVVGVAEQLTRALLEVRAAVVLTITEMLEALAMQVVTVR